jgi:galactofuranose transport system substrate-binding protein
VESGWDTVLQEVKSAGIPVILTDRAIDSPDTSLYRSFIGSDFLAEGRKAGEWLIEQYQGTTGDVNIVELQGTTGSAPANDRQQGFAEAIAANPRLKVVASQSGNFTRARGKEVMEALLAAHSDIDVLFAHNDDMALGAIQALQEAGMNPGKDVILISIDAVKSAFEAMVAGTLNATVECNPLMGPIVFDTINKLRAGEKVPKFIQNKDALFEQANAAQVIGTREY